MMKMTTSGNQKKKIIEEYKKNAIKAKEILDRGNLKDPRDLVNLVRVDNALSLCLSDDSLNALKKDGSELSDDTFKKLKELQDIIDQEIELRITYAKDYDQKLTEKSSQKTLIN